MSLGCAAGSCGACCDPVTLPLGPSDISRRWADPKVAGRNRADLAWMLRLEWLPDEDRSDGWHSYRCPSYDADARACTAHASRPPICRDYPYYQDTPEGNPNRALGLPRPCSFAFDFPPQLRRDGARPLIPITPI